MELEIKTEKRINIAPVQVLSHIRKNHAMEHAAIHILTKSKPGLSFAGYSFIKGFWIYGKSELQDIQKAVEIAHARLKNGEKSLAIHPNCGTNIAMTGLCTALVSMLALKMEGDDDSDFNRFSALTSAGLVGALLGRPLGPYMQKHITTDADVSNLSIVSITCSTVHGTPLFFVRTNLE